MREVIAVDFDDCVTPFGVPFRNWVHSEHGVDLVTVEAVAGKFHFDEAYPDSGVSVVRFTELIDEYTKGESIKTEPYEGAIEALQELGELFELHIVTARPPWHRDITIASVEQHLGTDVFAAIHTAEHNGDDKMTSKASMYRRIGAIAAIDDADHNVNAAIKTGLVGVSIQYPGQNYNGHSLDGDAIVVASLLEVVQYADRIKQQSTRN